MSSKSIILTHKPLPFFDTVKYREVYKKHKEFEALTEYSDKLQFWIDNDLFGFYTYQIFKDDKDKKPKIFSLVPKNDNETKLFNATLFKIYFDGGLGIRMKEITETIESSPLPTEYINDLLKEIETKVNNVYSKTVKDLRPEINSLNAYWYGYDSVKKNTTDKLFNMDADKTIVLMRSFASGAIDAHIKAYLVDKLKNLSTSEQQIKPTEIGKISHKILLLHKTGVLNFIADKHYSGIKGTPMAKLIGSLFNSDETELETIRKTLTYLDTKSKNNPENETSLRAVKKYLLDFDINLPELDKID